MSGHETVSLPRLASVVAVAKNGVIGRDGDLPWRIPSDLKRFKAITMGKPIVMGRKTWESLPRRPLPGRPNIVVSRSSNDTNDAIWVNSPDAAIDAGRRAATELGVDEVCVIGGAQLYRDLLDQTDRIYLTEIDLKPEGDAVFPDLDDAQWVLTSQEAVTAGDGDDAGFTIKIYDRC